MNPNPSDPRLLEQMLLIRACEEAVGVVNALSAEDLTSPTTAAPGSSSPRSPRNGSAGTRRREIQQQP